MRGIVFVLFTLQTIFLHAQDILPLFPGRKVEVKYATFSPDGKHLAIATAGDSLLMMDAQTYQIKRVVPIFSSGSPMSDTYTGRRIFHLTNGNVIYIAKKTEGATFSLLLRSETIDGSKTNYELKLHSIPAKEYDSEKLYNRLTYSLSVAGNIGLYALNDKIVSFDMTSGKLLKEWNPGYAFTAAMSKDGRWLAYANRDSVKIIETSSDKIFFRKAIEANAVEFIGDSVIVMGPQTVVYDAVKGKVLKKLYYNPGFIYGLDRSSNGTQFTLSCSYFKDHGFVGVFDKRTLDFSAVYHLPTTHGYVSFFQPRTNELFLITVRGTLYRFKELNQPTPVPQYGHRKELRSLSFSRDKRTLITTGSGGEILLWDVHTGRVLERLNTNDISADHAFFLDNDRDILLRSYGDYKKVHRSISSNAQTATAHNVFIDSVDQQYARKREEQLQQHNGKAAQLGEQYGLQSNKPVAMSSDYLVGFADQSILRIINLKTKAVQNHPFNEKLFGPSVMEMYDHRLVVTEGEMNTIIFIDVSTGKIVRRLGGMRSALRKGIQKIVFNETGDTVVTVTNHQKVQLWDFRKGNKLAEFSPSPNALQADAVDYRKGRLTLMAENNGWFIATVMNLNTGSVKMMAYLDTTFYQRIEMTEVAAHKANGYPMRLSLSPDGNQLYILRLDKSNNNPGAAFIDLWDLTKMSVTYSVPIADITYPCWNVSWEHQKIAVWDFLAASKKDVAAQKVLQQQSGSAVSNGHHGIKVFDMMTRKVDELSLDKLNISRLTEHSVKIVKANEAFVKDSYSFELFRVDLAKKSVMEKVDLSKHYFHDRVGADYAMANNELLYLVHPWNDGYTSQFRLYAQGTKKVVAEGETKGASISSLSALHATGVFAVGLNDNTLSVRDSKSLKERYRIVQDDEGHYAFVTPENYYKSDKASASALQFAWGSKSFSLNQFDAWFNRPDKVMAASGFAQPEDLAMLEKASLKRTKKTFGTDSLSSLLNKMPEVSIKNIQQLPFETALDSLAIEISATGKSSVISSLSVSVNGVPRLVPMKAPKDAASVSVKTYVKLLPGRNKISVTAINSEGVSSLPDEAEVTYTGAIERPDLYLVAVAINQYQDQSLNLRYAVKDARDIIRYMANDKRYRKVFVDSLFNTKVTLANVQNLKSSLKKARPQDMVIVFFAGHGVLDQNFDFRFGTWGLDVANPAATAVLYDDIENLLAGIRARNKLLLVDACHSGEVDKDEILQTTEKLIRERNGGERTVVTQSFGKVHHNVFESGLVDRSGFELMQELFMASSSKTGAQVVVATAGDSYAIESADWQNGFFTYALLNGLKSGVADTNQDRKITVDEMVAYLRGEVKQMSQGKQVPRFREENPDNYFVVFEK